MDSINKSNSLKGFPSQHFQSETGAEIDSMSTFSYKSAVNTKQYKPKPKTQGAYILITLKNCG